MKVILRRRCPVCNSTWDKSQMMCPKHPDVLGLLIVDYEDGKGWYRFN